ncbi:MAG: PP2C family protein-serine/threonine phosphatase [Acidobacteriota bacterium]
MEEKQLKDLRRELKLKKIQFNSIYEFSSSIYSSFSLDSIMRIYFSTIMGQMGILNIFFMDMKNDILEKKGVRFSENEKKILKKGIRFGKKWFQLNSEEIPEKNGSLKDLLSEKKIFHLINLSESEKKPVVLGLGKKFGRLKLSDEDIEFAFFVSRFALIAIENSFMVNRMIENKRMEHEINIARDIQLSLLPQEVPVLDNFEISVTYKPIYSVGGDYYDILNEKNGKLPVLIADVEGKGLSAALLAASSQAVFHSLNELYLSEPGNFLSKANSLIYDFTRGKRFITIFWMLLDDKKREITYVNAGHEAPLLISGNSVYPLSKGGFLTGFTDTAQYDKEDLSLKPGDIVVAFTDGVPEIENKAGEEFGVEKIIKFIKKNRKKSADQINEALFKKLDEFSERKKPRDDCTFILLKVK